MAQVTKILFMDSQPISTIFPYDISLLKNFNFFAELLDEKAPKPLPFQARITYSAKSTAPVPKTATPALPAKIKPVTSNPKKGQPEKHTSRAKPKIWPEENQPKVSSFFKPLIVLGNSSSSDDFLPDLVPPKMKLIVKSKDSSLSPNYSPNYTYNFRSRPYALSS